MGLFIKQHYEVGWTEAAAELAGLWQRGPAGSGRQQSTATKAAVLSVAACCAEQNIMGLVLHRKQFRGDDLSRCGNLL